MHYVYVLKSLEKDWSYIGSSSNLEERFQKHNEGYVKSTKFYRPFELVYYEAYTSLGLARKREHKLKNHSQKKKLLFDRLGL